MIAQLEQLLDYLCEHCDRERLERSHERTVKSLMWQEVDRPPVVVSGSLPADFPFRPFPFHEMFESVEKMLYNELLHAFDLSIAASHLMETDLPWTIRANYGTVLLASMYGAAVEQVADNPPWVRHDTGHDLSIEQILDVDPSDVDSGWMPRVRETMEQYTGLLAGHEPLSGMISITLPDLQGPFDNFEQIRGNSVFTDLFDDPEKASEAMANIAEKQVAVARSLQPLTSDGPDGFCHQHGFMLRGNILLRCDSAIMVSPDMYRDLIAPHDNYVMEAMGGGAIHSCGDIMHLLDEYVALPALQSLDFGQSEMNDRDVVYAKAREKGIALIRVHTTKEELASGEFQQNYPTGVAAIFRNE